MHFKSTRNIKFKLYLVSKQKKLEKISKKVEKNGRFNTKCSRKKMPYACSHD